MSNDSGHLQPPEHMERNGRAYNSPPPWMVVVRPQWPGTNFEVAPPDRSSSATHKLYIF
jgi:hypothetical protein